MPSMSGIELFQNIIEWEKENSLRKLPLFISSGYTDEEFVRTCLENGATEVISKPYT